MSNHENNAKEELRCALRDGARDLQEEAHRLSQTVAEFELAIDRFCQRVDYMHPGALENYHKVAATMGSISFNDIGRAIKSVEELIHCIRNPDG